MKRVLTFLAIMLLPLSVMAMTPVTDSDLADVTGQAGVNINADLTMDIAIGTMAWGDDSGVDAPWDTVSADAGGYVGVTGFNITNLRIKARENDTYNGYSTLNLKPITIDVATGTEHGGRTFVRFGLGSLQITMNAMSFNVALGAYNGGSPTLDQVMGSANLGAMSIYINPISYVDIWSHAGQGVNISMYVVVDEFQMGYMSWGDGDGLPGGSTGTGVIWMANGFQSAGYIGLADLVVGGPILISGTVIIDVTSSYAGIYNHGSTDPVSVVRIAFDDNFTMFVTGPITADVKLDNVAALNSAYAGTLGDIYISGFGLSIYNGSWVDIWAH